MQQDVSVEQVSAAAAVLLPPFACITESQDRKTLHIHWALWWGLHPSLPGDKYDPVGHEIALKYDPVQHANVL